MRSLFQKQLDLLRGLEARLEDIKAGRSRRVDFLKALWLHAVDLQAAAGDSARTGRISDRIRKLFEQIDEHTGGRSTKSSGETGDTDAFSDLPTVER
jgi:uncharacterized protein YPO0396